MVGVSVGWMMVARGEDLERWGEDPEGYTVDVSRSSPDADVRAAGQGLLLALVEAEESKSLALNLLATRMRDYDAQRSAAEREARSASETERGGIGVVRYVCDLEILKWDAIYTAAGVASSSLSGFEFVEWFGNSLGPSLTVIIQGAASSNSNNSILPVLRHRIVWLLGCWVSSLDAPSRPQVYAALASVLSLTDAKSDAAVRLACVETIGGAFEDWDFDAASFQGLAKPVVEAMYGLMRGLEEVRSAKERSDDFCGAFAARPRPIPYNAQPFLLPTPLLSLT